MARTLILDAQISPIQPNWINDNFPGVEAISARSLNLLFANDLQIFQVGREMDATVITKDFDFVNLLERFGPPPNVILLNCGNTSNAVLKEVFQTHLLIAIKLIESGESLVEIF